jgi:hypothetical protein
VLGVSIENANSSDHFFECSWTHRNRLPARETTARDWAEGELDPSLTKPSSSRGQAGAGLAGRPALPFRNDDWVRKKPGKKLLLNGDTKVSFRHRRYGPWMARTMDSVPVRSTDFLGDTNVDSTRFQQSGEPAAE